ncbi:MAG: YceH family protein [Armatimonadetes bacterium]|nr:YceH family protein [Armatimonadota bacterium]
MDFHFRPDELRVLGCLIEKRFSTPDSYPLTMNALIAACNQSSNRDPVVRYDQAVVNGALKSTRAQGYSLIVTSADARVPKFKETVCEKLSLDRPRAAVLAELLLRGPQTPGELRQRTPRMYEFPDLPSVESSLAALMERDVPLVTPLPRQPGRREIRYAHLLAGPIEDLPAGEPAPAPPVPRSAGLEERVEALERQMEEVMAKLSRWSP